MTWNVLFSLYGSRYSRTDQVKNCGRQPLKNLKRYGQRSQLLWKVKGCAISIMFFSLMTWKVYFIQAWSIMYHSWLTFVLLFWACLTWITPFARWFCMVSSPYLVVYADILLIIQYVYGMELTNEELPESVGKFNFSELGLSRKKYPVLHLGAQVDIPKVLVLWFLFYENFLWILLKEQKKAFKKPLLLCKEIWIRWISEHNVSKLLTRK